MKKSTSNTYRQIFRYNKNIGHLFVPNIKARIMNEKGGYYVNTNSLGFRSNIEFKEKKGKKPRILFFGDSNTAADGRCAVTRSAWAPLYKPPLACPYVPTLPARESDHASSGRPR